MENDYCKAFLKNSTKTKKYYCIKTFLIAMCSQTCDYTGKLFQTDLAFIIYLYFTMDCKHDMHNQRKRGKQTMQWTMPQLSVRFCSVSAVKGGYCGTDIVFCLCTFCSMQVGRLKELRESKEPNIAHSQWSLAIHKENTMGNVRSQTTFTWEHIQHSEKQVNGDNTLKLRNFKRNLG